MNYQLAHEMLDAVLEKRSNQNKIPVCGIMIARAKAVVANVGLAFQLKGIGLNMYNMHSVPNQVEITGRLNGKDFNLKVHEGGKITGHIPGNAQLYSRNMVFSYLAGLNRRVDEVCPLNNPFEITLP